MAICTLTGHDSKILIVPWEFGKQLGLDRRCCKTQSIDHRLNDYLILLDGLAVDRGWAQRAPERLSFA
jgi:hypothetical protein